MEALIAEGGVHLGKGNHQLLFPLGKRKIRDFKGGVYT